MSGPDDSAAGPSQRRRGDGAGRNRIPGSAWLWNRFWLVLPVLALNAAVAPYLPPPYGPQAFSAGIPAALIIAENVLRALLCAAPAFMPLTPRRGGLWLYGTGLAAYAGAWLAVMAAPESPWSTGLIGFTAPAWTSLLWLAGIGWGSSLRFVPGYRPWMYLAAGAVFTAVHTLHAGLAWLQHR
ncbi:hypothetical protein QNO08_07660 [Arthrobacter sp. zg-Y820]|uniref:hypothetical protein n=1 Tax=unclassified Arthrobacter TaxID=235627 RepID=UPI001E3C392B|nr:MULTISPECIES: hypothetical protein [unclassified Arthrobacter]MCC9197605.1 hypothetical protein [Arthrobacter sp. zg-Y820]MDK1280472.1 hypothetical protein [Arthrobacter sp. zg.Y820]WIB10886.1 hypothetical protein QNO08_07660 [Arthrobacter sp. zg-Y820]